MSNSATPLVSIVVPAYNHAKYLPEAIESILAQDYKNVELIVLDDGSTDNTPEVLKNYAGKFYFESHKNMGQANTLNKGWRMAKGEILAYLSADDVLYPQAVSECVDSLQNNKGAVLSYPDFDLIDPQSRVVRKVIAPEYSYRVMLTQFLCAPGPGAFFKRSAYEKAGEWDPQLRHSPDYEYWLRLGLHGNFVHVNENLAAFRVHEGSQSFAQTTLERAEEPIRIMTKYYELPNLPAESIAVKSQAFANANIMVAQLHLRASRFKEAILRVKEAITISPRTFLTIRVFRMLFNGLFNRLIHKIIWFVKDSLSWLRR